MSSDLDNHAGRVESDGPDYTGESDQGHSVIEGSLKVNIATANQNESLEHGRGTTRFIDRALIRSIDPVTDMRTSEQCLEAVELAKQDLANAPVGDKRRAICLNSLAGQIADHHQAIWREISERKSQFSRPEKALKELGVGRLPEAVKYVEEALEISDEDDFIHGSSYNTLQELYYRMYDCTTNDEDLALGIENGEKAVKHANDHKDTMPSNAWHFYYAHRTNLLASGWRRRYNALDAPDNTNIDEERRARMLEYLNNACRYQGESADESTSQDGIQRWNRFQYFCDLIVRRAYLGDDVSQIQAILDLAKRQPYSWTEHEECLRSEQCDFECTVRKNFLNILTLLCRRWAWTRELRHKEELIEYGRSDTDWLGIHKIDPHVEQRDIDLDVIKAMAITFSAYTMNEKSEWSKDVATMNVVVALYEEVLKATGADTLVDLKQREVSLGALTFYMNLRYTIAKNPSYGWEAERISLEWARTKELVKTMLDQGTMDVDSTTIDQPFVTTDSQIIRSRISCIDNPKVTGLGAHKLCFAHDGLPDAENWIRERKSDGTFDLGATPGRDDEVLAAIERWYEGDVPAG